MRLALLVSLFAVGCTDTTSTAQPDLTSAPIADLASSGQDLAAAPDLAPSGPTLTVNNTFGWCTVTVTVGSAAPVMFATASKAFSAASGTTVTLSATPNPTFKPVVWTGTTTMSGTSATYLMTGAATQTVTACCPTMAGTGC